MENPAELPEHRPVNGISSNDWSTIVQELRNRLRGADRLLKKLPDDDDLDFVEHEDFKDSDSRHINVLPFKLRLSKSETETIWVYFNYFDKKAPTLTFIREYKGEDPSELHHERLEGNTAGDIAMDGPFHKFQNVDDVGVRNQSFRAVIKALFVAGGIITAEKLLGHGSAAFYKHFISGLKILNGPDRAATPQGGIRHRRREEESPVVSRSPSSSIQEEDRERTLSHDDEQADERYERLRKLHFLMRDTVKSKRDVKLEVERKREEARRKQEEARRVQEEARTVQEELKRAQHQLAIWEQSEAAGITAFEREWKALSPMEIVAYIDRIARLESGRQESREY